jgi:hypothetical protein
MVLAAGGDASQNMGFNAGSAEYWAMGANGPNLMGANTSHTGIEFLFDTRAGVAPPLRIFVKDAGTTSSQQALSIDVTKALTLYAKASYAGAYTFTAGSNEIPSVKYVDDKVAAGGVVLNDYTADPTSYTTFANADITTLPDLTGAANATVTITTPPVKKFIYFRNQNTDASTFLWTFSPAVKDIQGNNVTSVANLATYKLFWNGTNYLIMSIY